MYKRTVLVVDDEPLIQMMLAEALEDGGYDVVEAGTALEALVAMEENDISAVITDVDMPGGVSGVELACHIDSCRKGLPVIITSGGTFVGVEDTPSCAVFVPKPYDLTGLLNLLTDMITHGPDQSGIRRNVG